MPLFYPFTEIVVQMVQMVQQFLEPLRLKGLRLRIAAPTIFFIGAWKKLVVQ